MRTLTSERTAALALLGWLLACPLLAQHPGVDSLDRLLARWPATETRRVAALTERARFHWLSGSDSLSRRDATAAVRLAQQFGDGRGEARARLWLARLESENEVDFATGYAQADTAERLAQRLRDYSLLGQVYYRRMRLGQDTFEKHALLMPWLRRAEQCFRKANDRVGLAQVYEAYGMMQLTQGDRAGGIEWMLKALRQLDGLRDDWARRALVTNLGSIYADLKQREVARRYFAEAEGIASRLHDQRLKAYMLVRQGEMQLEQGQTRPALALFERAIDLQERLQIYGTSRTYCFLAQAHLRLGDFAKALDYNRKGEMAYLSTVDAKEALTHAAQTQYGQIYLAQKQYARVVPYAEKGLYWASTATPPLVAEMSEYHRQLAFVYERLGQPDKALGHLKRHKALSDTLLNTEVIERSTAARLGAEFEQKEQAAQLRQVAQQNKIRELENAQLSRLRNFLLSLLGLGLAGLGYVVWTNRRLRGKNEELSRKNAEIEGALLRGQTLERKRVASELHDSVAAKVSALKWQLEALDTAALPESEQRFHARLVSQMEGVYEDVRAISHNLMPEILEKQGLQSALAQLGDTLNRQNRTEFALDLGESGEIVRGKTAYELYAITLELVNNILKHADARRATISLRRRPDSLQLRVRDDGRGMGEVPPHGGMGMANLRSRVEALRGQLHIETPTGGGTEVVVSV
jgi:signal transduction histidine kinase